LGGGGRWRSGSRTLNESVLAQNRGVKESVKNRVEGGGYFVVWRGLKIKGLGDCGECTHKEEENGKDVGKTCVTRG